jgi:predicted short-subunit dehydrogenase-like oxidoreductase (DUF2520 family)
MMKPYTVSFIGSGNLAWNLALALDNTDFAVREVYSRNASHAAELVGNLYSGEVMTTPDFSNSPSRIFIMAVPDDAIEDLARAIALPPNSILVHTSGSQPLSALGYAPTPKIGVFYPLQTFTKGKRVDFEDVPFFVESEDSETEKVLMAMGKAISKKVFRISSEDRKALHVAAVFASNFTNHMLYIAQQVMKDNKLKFDWLKPLVAETLNKSLAIGPDKAQTGPARRGDLEILDRHLEFLQGNQPVAEIYKVVSQHIVDTYCDPEEE